MIQSHTNGIEERVKAILQSKGFVLHQLSQLSGKVFGKSSPYFVPHNFYYDLGLESFSPSLHQIFALSKLSGYRFYDWLRVFGLRPEEVTRQQILLPSKRTMLIDTSLEDPETWIPWFKNKSADWPISGATPLTRVIEPSQPFRAGSFMPRGRFLYAKVGNEDAFAFPQLLPGSIVRGDTRYQTNIVSARTPETDGRLFIVQHSHGICCCNIQGCADGRLVLIASNLPFAQAKLRLEEEVRILAVIDLEIRSLLLLEKPKIPAQLARRWRPSRLPEEVQKLSVLIRRARNKMSLSFREASAISRQIAERLGDTQYFVAPSALSDFEATDKPPRHIQKALTLCVIYGLHFEMFLKSAGIDWNSTGTEPIPDALLPRKLPSRSSKTSHQPTLAQEMDPSTLVRNLGEIPIFMRNSLSNISGLRHPKLNDFFGTRTQPYPLHWLFRKDSVFMVNRQKKRPHYSRMNAPWQQPVYLLLKRDGSYICACCSLEDDVLVMHSQGEHSAPQIEFRNHRDAEVVGRIVSVCRYL